MPTAPPFTRDNAGEMARRATVAREARRAREKAILREYAKNPPVDADDDARRKRVLKQIARCDSLLLTCSAAEFPAMTAAKERLWKLVFPTAGVLKPRRNDRPRMPEARGVPIPAPQAPEAVQTENPPKAQ